MTGAATFSMEPALVSLAWLPWQLAFVRATLRSQSHWVLAAIGLGGVSALCVVGGHLPYLPVAVVVCGLYATMELGWLAWHSGLRTAAVRGARLFLAAAVVAGLAAAQLLPTLELAGRSVRAGAFQSAQAADPFPIPPIQLLLGLVNSLPTRFGFTAHSFMGVAAVGLAVVPCIDRRYWRRALALWVVGSVVTLLALGTSTPVFGWYLHVQGSSIRIPEHFLSATALSLALLSALGADALCRARRTLLALLAVLLTTAVPLILMAAAPADLLAKAPRLSAALALTRSHTLWVAAIGSLFLLPGPWCRRWLRPAAVLVAAGLIAYELHGSMQLKMAIPATRPNALKTPIGAATFVRTHGGMARIVTPISPSRAVRAGEIPVRLGMLENLQAVSDYEPLVDRRFAELMWTLSSSFLAGPANAHLGPWMNEVTEQALPLLRFLGVGFIMVAPNGGAHVRLPGPIYSDTDAAVYAVSDPLPRAYVAKDIRSASTPEQARTTVLADLSWVLDRGAIVEDGKFLGAGSDGSIVVRRYDAEVVELEADLSRPGLVVLEDQYDPFWRASVDGVQVPIVRTNYVFRGVPTEAGRHTIRFSYHPSLIYAGAAVSLLTLLVLLTASILWLRHRLTQWRTSVVARAIPGHREPR
jgi:hypothetical protein